MPPVRRLLSLIALLTVVTIGCEAAQAPAWTPAPASGSAVPSLSVPVPPAAPPVAPLDPAVSASSSSSSPDSSPDPLASAPAAAGSPPPAANQPAAEADLPIVPIVDFRSTETSVDAADVAAVLAGRSGRYQALELVAADADPILAALGVAPPADPARLIRVADAATLARDLAVHRDRLAFVRAGQVGPSVRALGWGGRELFGVDRVRSLADWPLAARLAANDQPFDPGSTWTLVAGGDILLDRGVARQVTILGRGVDFPFAGGSARITGRFCCSSFGWELPRTRRTGDPGAVRHLLQTADLAVANFENPAPDAFRYHVQGTVFSADPRLIDGLRNAGLDWVSLANNHIRDAGASGLLQTIANLDRRGIAHSGAGRDLAAARKAAILVAGAAAASGTADGATGGSAGGIRVAFLGYDTIAPSYAAGTGRAGSAPMSAAALRRDVAAARAAGAQVVVVYPHWGVEYTARTTSLQRALGRAAIDAGADLVIGNHPHWVGAMEVYRGRPIWYALGNFVFDQAWSEPTQEGLLLELTFRGRTLVQVRLHPTIILDQAQPNLLDPGRDGAAVLDQLYQASGRLLGW